MEKGRPQPGRPFPVPSERGLETETDAADAIVAAANAVFILAALIFSRDVSVASHSKLQAATIAHASERSTRVSVRRYNAGIRSEERRGGKSCVRTGRSRWSL